MSNKIITAPQYILLYTDSALDEVGKKYWLVQGIYDTEEQAIAALLSMPDHTYKHAQVVKTRLPILTLPDDFGTITGETTHDQQ